MNSVPLLNSVSFRCRCPPPPSLARLYCFFGRAPGVCAFVCANINDRYRKRKRPLTTTELPPTVAALTVRIDSLHELVNSTARMDFACKRGYVKLLARRRKMLAYLKRKDFETYRKVALKTGLR